MKLSIDNIGKISKAEIELNGITIIAGENDTGKSTVGKVLYSIFNSFYQTERQINYYRVSTVERILDNTYEKWTYRMPPHVDTVEIARSIVENKNAYSADAESLKAFILASFTQDNEKLMRHNVELDGNSDEITRILDALSISDDEIIERVLNNKLDREFQGQINNVFSNSQGLVRLKIKGDEIVIAIAENNVTEMNNRFQLNTEVVYLDDPFIIDDARRLFVGARGLIDHQNHLKRILLSTNTEDGVIDEIINFTKLKRVFEKLNSVCGGEMVKNKSGNFGYKSDGKILDSKNISAGLKTFAIIKVLLENGSIEPNGTIILDEPEIHLHPQWQVVFAELIVLIQQEFGLHVLINTHSPYFISAVEVFAEKYNLESKCKYYLAENQNDLSVFTDVTGDTEKIYYKLARPLQDLENRRFENA